MRKHYEILLLLIACLGLILSPIVAQETTPEPVPLIETTSELLPPPLMPSETATATATSTLTETPTETPVATGPEVTPEATNEILPTATATIANPFATPTATPLPNVGENGVFADNFDSGDLSAWTFAGAGWGLLPQDTGGNALRVYNSESPVALNLGDFYNAAAEIRANVDNGTVYLSIRQSSAGSYTVSLDTGGNVTLTRSGVVVATGAISSSREGWHTLQLSSVENVIAVAVDGADVVSYTDTASLPPGTIAFHASFTPLASEVTPIPPINTVLVDDFVLWQMDETTVVVATATASSSATLTVTPTLTLTTEPTAESNQPFPQLLASATPDGYENKVSAFQALSASGASLTFVQNFTNTSLQPGEVIAPHTSSGNPNFAVVGFLSTDIAAWAINYPAPPILTPMNVEVTLTLTQIPGKSYRVTGLQRDWLVYVYQQAPITLSLAGTIYDENNSQLYQASCLIIYPTSFTCPQWSIPAGVANAHHVKFTFTAVETDVIAGLGLDDFVVFTDTPICLAQTASAYPNTPQMAVDMQLVSSSGLSMREAPTINATKKSMDIPWNAQVGIRSRIEFPQQNPPNQIWYEVIYDGQSGWVLARMGNASYFVNLTDTNDPCASEVENFTGNLTFTYDRQAAAKAAIAHGNNNKGIVGGTATYHRATTRTIEAIPYAEFVYALTFGPQGSTASAAFMSEMLWLGGFPMTLNTEVCYEDIGWRFCPPANGVPNTGNFSKAWKVHEDIIEYYTRDTVVPFPNTTEENQGDNNEILEAPSLNNLLGVFIPFGPLFSDDASTISRDAVLSFIDSKSLSLGTLADSPNSRFNITGLSQYMRNFLGTIEQGDYLWIDSQTAAGSSADAHGLLVVGWANATSCDIAMTQNFSIVSFYATQGEANIGDPVVPYIVDFNRLQRPSARPFYCTAYQDPQNTTNPSESYFGGNHSWYFYSMPDTINISSSQLYTSLQWQWEAQ